MSALPNIVSDDLKDRLTRVHMRLMNHDETRLYSSVILLGKSQIVDDVPTACTDGINKMYGAAFMSSLSDAELGAIVLHENIHVMLKHLPRHRDLMKEDPQLANIAMDYVDNLLIDEIADKSLAKLPEHALLDHKYRGWSVREVYNDLKQEEEKKGGGKGGRPSTLDDHDFSNMREATPEEIKKLSDIIDDCIQQAGTLAGREGKPLPRAVADLMDPEVDWVEEMRDYVTQQMHGRDEATWRKYNRKRLIDDIFFPTTHSETIGEMVVACDLSGSIDDKMVRKFLSEIEALCDTCKPQRLRVLWWDTIVRSEQIFDEASAGISAALKPIGGGGTYVGCVSKYMIDNNINPEVLIVLTDGHVEPQIDWQVAAPTLWMITQNRDFTPPGNGVKVRINS